MYLRWMAITHSVASVTNARWILRLHFLATDIHIVDIRGEERAPSETFRDGYLE